MAIKDLAISKRIIKERRVVSMGGIRRAKVLCAIRLIGLDVDGCGFDTENNFTKKDYIIEELEAHKNYYDKVMSYGIKHKMRTNRVGRYINLYKPKKGIRLINLFKLLPSNFYRDTYSLRFNKRKMLDDLEYLNDIYLEKKAMLNNLSKMHRGDFDGGCVVC